MLFDDQTLTDGYAFAGSLSEEFKSLSAADMKLAMLAAVGNVSLPYERLEQVRRRINVPHVSGSLVLFVIAALCEMDRIRGGMEIPPTRVIDIMSHMQIYRDEIPSDAVIQCHGDGMLPLALWFASCGVRVCFDGSCILAECASVIADNEIFCPGQHPFFAREAYHFAMLLKRNVSLASFYRELTRSSYRGAVILTTWSFLSSASPKEFRLKQEMASSGELRTVIQLPAGLMPRVLPALLRLAPQGGRMEEIRLVDAKDWFVVTNGVVKVSYLFPIFSQVDRRRGKDADRHAPVPPAEDISAGELARRKGDLRMRREPIGDGAKHACPLEDCAMLVRGQMLPVLHPGQPGHAYREVVLTDIDSSGFVCTASRLVEGTPRLSPQRELAILRRNDILLSVKGSLASLGTVGLVADCGQGWLPSQTFYLIRPESIDPLWLFYFLRSSSAQNYLKSHSSGTTVPQIKVSDLYAMPVPVPEEAKLKEIRKLHAKMLKLVGKFRKLEEARSDVWDQCEEFFEIKQ